MKILISLILMVGGGVFWISLLPNSSYAISIDDEEDDIEDVKDLLSKAKVAAKENNFQEANSILQKAKRYGVLQDEIKDTQELINKQKRAYITKIEKKKREKLRRLKEAKLKKLKELERLRAKQKELQRQRYSSNSYSSTLKNLCLGVTKYPSFCYKIRDSDYRNLCLGIKSNNSSNSCYQIKESNLRNLCLGVTKYPTSCYKIRNINYKNLCLGMQSNNSSNSCYQIRDPYLKNLCLGATQYPSFCYKF